MPKSLDTSTHASPLSGRGRWREWGFLLLTALLAALAMRLTYKEDISDFLPLGTADRENLAVYQDISGAGRLFVIFNNPGDPDRTVEAVEAFRQEVGRRDTAGWTASMTAQIDLEDIGEVQDFVYRNIPYFLTDADYARMDSLLGTEDYADRRLREAREALMLPGGGLLSDNIGRDPLNLFAPVVARLQRQRQDTRFETYDGYIFTPDMKRAVVTLTSPFGNAETEKNARLVSLLEDALGEVAKQHHADIKATIAGGPQVAVGNAGQIKRDSILAIGLAAVLILTLLFRSFRSVKNILLIALTIGWGWLFALAGMALLHDSVSLIVIGLSSIILGIAVNYPLHLVAHLSHEPDIRRAMKDISAPLLIGNVTTVGAFLALVPLRSAALRDLGLFASLMLAGTIVFVLFFLPRHVAVATERRDNGLLTRLAAVRPENKKWLVWTVAVLTVVFAWQATKTEFDTNMANLNYMTDSQREEMDYFRRLTAADSASAVRTLYVVSSARTMDEALAKNMARQREIDSVTALMPRHITHEGVTPFLCPIAEQRRRLAMWRDFVGRNGRLLTEGLDAAAERNGFADGAFDEFRDIIAASYQPREAAHFALLTDGLLAGNISIDKAGGRYSVIDKLYADGSQAEELRQQLPGSFTVESMNSAMASSLSDNFNYIGFACSLIVFLFLWFSFGRLELALLAFLPMAVSWIWILGIMALLGVKFNIVNVILATFIFGQGDDYTIFMTEGCQYEYAHRRPMLASYKHGITLSALIMFIGIGTLITARHPALHSLAEVTIIGMSSVVLMAWLLPPLVFNLLTRRRNGEYRLRPLTIGGVMRRLCGKGGDGMMPKACDSRGYAELVYERYLYKGLHIQRTVGRSLRANDCFSSSVDRDYAGREITVENCGYGEEALLMALVHPDKTVIARDPDPEKLSVLRSSAEGLVTNIRFASGTEGGKEEVTGS